MVNDNDNNVNLSVLVSLVELPLVDNHPVD